MKLLSLLILLCCSQLLNARTIEVSLGGTYSSLQAAAAVAEPGDTILFRGGVYPGGQSLSNLQGRADAWITILAAPGEEVILRGGGNAWQLSDAAYLVISGFNFEGQTGNGLNLDDAGTYDTPAHHIIVEKCHWRSLAATGNNDQLKMSGIDSFEVRECVFEDGAAGGSAIDMVGCHNGRFTRNVFERAGSNSIQAKGGTRYIRIERNTFVDGGARGINIGGSTGLEFFRPLGANYESMNIWVYSNTFVGSDAPVAFVGTVDSEVVNNTFYLPTRWAFRILQETTAPGFLQCGDNVYRNNIVVVGSNINASTVNIGSNTRPETFRVAHNLWYNISNPNWTPTSLPAPETNGITRQDPLLASPPAVMTPRPGSPAIGIGYIVTEPTHDYFGNPFASPRSIGAIEGATTSSAPDPGSRSTTFTANYDMSTGMVSVKGFGEVKAMLYDMRGERQWSAHEARSSGAWSARIPIETLSAGNYLLVVRCGVEVRVMKIGR